MRIKKTEVKDTTLKRELKDQNAEEDQMQQRMEKNENWKRTQTKRKHLGPVGRVRLIKEGPDFWLRVLPSGHLPAVVLVLEAKLLGNLLVARLVRLNVQLVEDGQGGLGVPVGGVGHPATGLHLQGCHEETGLESQDQPDCYQDPKTQAPPQKGVHIHLRFLDRVYL